MKRVPFRKSLFISLACHLLGFSLFSFTFLQNTKPSCPTFYFLGSILTSQDVLSPIFIESPIRDQTPIPLVSRRISRSKVNPSRMVAVPKPKGIDLVPHDKIHQKTFFETIEQAKKEEIPAPPPPRIEAPKLKLKATEIYRTDIE